MEPEIREMVAATYVRDIGLSRAFYELMGFAERRSGAAATSAWCVLATSAHMLLLVSTQPPLSLPKLPLLFDFFFADLGAAIGQLAAAGVQFEHLGYPEHARGGEVKLLDPDGNTVLLSQRVPSAPRQGAPDDDDAALRFSILREAAALVAAQAPQTERCQMRFSDGVRCDQDAEVKLADSSGYTAWLCLPHAEEILVSVPGAFIASHDERGIAEFLQHRSG